MTGTRHRIQTTTDLELISNMFDTWTQWDRGHDGIEPSIHDLEEIERRDNMPDLVDYFENDPYFDRPF